MRALNLRLEAALGGNRRIVVRLQAGRPAEQRAGAFRRQMRVDQRRLQLCDLRLLGRHIGLKRALLKLIEKIALLDLGAFVEKALFQKRSDASNDVDAVGSLDAPVEFVSLCDRLFAGLDNSNRGWRRRSGLRARRAHGNRR